MRYRKMRLSEIKLGENPRGKISKDGLQRLVRSIERVGLICPLIVDTRGKLLDGYRRRDALVLLGQIDEVVPVIEADKDASAVVLAVEGGWRAHSGYDRARHWAKLVAAGWSVADISTISTKSATNIRHALKALEVMAKVRLSQDKFPMVASGLNNLIPIPEITQAIANLVVTTARQFNSAPLVRKHFRRWYTDRRGIDHLAVLAAKREARGHQGDGGEGDSVSELSEAVV